MKAIAAPEKLYLLPNGLISYCRNTDEDVEYTCTDAFIGKACKWLNKELYTRFSGNEHFVASSKAINLQEFIKNFKNYMLCQ